MKNPLLLSIYDLTAQDCANSAVALAEAIESGDAGLIEKAIMDTPAIPSIIAFGVLPLIFAIILTIAVPIFACSVCSCNALAVSNKRLAKLNKELNLLMQARNVDAGKKASRAEKLQALVSRCENFADDGELQRLVTSFEEALNLQAKAAQRQKCKVWWVVAWYAFAALGLLSVIFFIIGTAEVTGLPNKLYNQAVSDSEVYLDVFKDVQQQVDELASDLTGYDTEIVQSFFQDSQSVFEGKLIGFQATLSELKTVKDPIVRSFKLVEGQDASLIKTVGSALFFPSDPTNQLPYVKQGEDMITLIQEEVGSLDSAIESTDAAISTITATKDYPSKIQEVIDGMNLSNIDLNIYDMLPTELTELIKLIVTEKDPYKFATTAVQLIGRIAPDLKPLLDNASKIVVQCSSSNGPCVVPTLQEVVYNLTGENLQEILGRDFNADNVIAWLREGIPTMIDEIRGWKQWMSTNLILESIDHVRQITLKDLIKEMTTTCQWVWCDILPSIPIQSYQIAAEAGVYILVLSVPIIALVLCVVLVALRRKACVSCQASSCWCCSFCTSIFTIIMLCLTVAGPLVITPLVQGSTKNFTQTVDAGLYAASQFTDMRFDWELPDPTSYLVFTPQRITLDCTSTAALLSSFKFQIHYDLEKHMQLLFDTISGFDVAGIVSALLQPFLKSDMSISFAGSDLSMLLNKEAAVAIGTIIKFNGKTLEQYAKDELEGLLDSVVALDEGDFLPQISQFVASGAQETVTQLWSKYLDPVFANLQNIKTIEIPEQTICDVNEFINTYTEAVNATSFSVLEQALAASAIENVVVNSPTPAATIDQAAAFQTSLVLEAYTANGVSGQYMTTACPQSNSLDSCARDVAQNEKLFLKMTADAASKIVGRTWTGPLDFSSPNALKKSTSLYAAYSQEQINSQIEYVNKVKAGDPYDSAALLQFDKDLVAALTAKGVDSFSGFDGEKPLAGSATLNAELDLYVLNLAKATLYVSTLQTLGKSNALETDQTLPLATDMTRMDLALQSVLALKGVLQSVQFLVQHVIGKAAISCLPALEPKDAIIDVLPQQSKSVTSAIATNMGAALGVSPVFCPVKEALEDAGAFEASADLAQIAVDGAVDIMLAEDSMIGSKLMGQLTLTTTGLFDTTVNPFNAWCFAFYLFFLFSAIGVILLVAGYGWFLARGVSQNDGLTVLQSAGYTGQKATVGQDQTLLGNQLLVI